MTTLSLPQLIDDKSPICISFILERLKERTATTRSKPFIIGLNGVQGVGKTTLVKSLANTLRKGKSLETLVLSLDDFYLKHEDQIALAALLPDNALVQVRGEPGTHDMTLAQEFFTAICDGKLTKVPQYDKSAHSGKGDRVGSQQWKLVNGPAMPKVEVIIFEGWCVGFRQLSVSEVEAKWNAQSRTLKRHKLEHLQFVNNQLGHYDVLTNLFDALIHIDAEDTEYVYHWRLEQEAMLRKEKGPGMTDEEVICFVDAYYPAYELFSEKLRSGLFGDKMDHQLRLVVDKDRKVKQAIVM